MNIIGINSGRAAPPRIDPEKVRPLADGSAALLKNGTVNCAAIEERFTRVRYSGGFRNSLLACLRHGGIELNDVDAVGHSTCCDSAWSNSEDILDNIIESCDGIYTPAEIRSGLEGKLYTIRHHRSHATLAFVGSGFEKALVVVVDGLGNRGGDTGQFDISENWWRGAFHRHDVYLCEWQDSRMHIQRVHEDAHKLEELGIGEIYRSVTHFLGWPSYQYAGKTMALAPFGSAKNLLDLRLIDFIPPYSVRVPVANLHDKPMAQIEGAIRAAGYTVPEVVKRPATPDDPFLCDIAAVLQQQTEAAIISSVSALADKYKVAHVAFGGGVAMNCVALGKFAKAHPDLHLYVPPAPADTGQALGNALWLAYADDSPLSKPTQTKPRPINTAALGVLYDSRTIDEAVAEFLHRCPGILARRVEITEDLIDKMVEDLAAGVVVGLRQGRAEYGPRALGQASILADPRIEEMHARVSAYKRREPFRPYAPSILAEHVGEYLEIDTDSPFMSFAGVVREEKRGLIPSVVHIDGSARYQSVEMDGGFYRRLLEAWYRQTGIPVLLNTSFNCNGEPIVETPADTLACFEKSGLPVLVLENWYICRDATKP